ncbi:hypothetical protein AVEN_51648-1 [Araneus ventricosus]|uniref:Uncharacterized protein n=1 Tax=Araneus ventricosus TaxID=182803 RepID=A0A4Y2SQE1_ARAVE|nr:hypothetical protein AVEN_51648-1 [Araneus ventricosus]
MAVFPLNSQINRFSLVISVSRFEETRGLFWDEPHYFEPLSDDETTPELEAHAPIFHTTPAGGVRFTTYDLKCSKTTNKADLQWNVVLNL